MAALIGSRTGPWGHNPTGSGHGGLRLIIGGNADARMRGWISGTGAIKVGLSSKLFAAVRRFERWRGLGGTPQRALNSAAI